MKSPFEITIKYVTDDEAMKEQIADYFKLIGEKFVYSFKSLCEKYGARTNQVFRNQIKGKFVALNTYCYCKKCGDIIKSIEDRNQIASYDNEEVCDKCSQAQEDTRLALIDKHMYEAMENAAFHGLNLVELSFFKEIIKLNSDYMQAGKHMGMCERNIMSCMESLKEKKLLHYDFFGFPIRLLPEYTQLLGNDSDAPIKQFITDNNRALYKKLRREHPYVYPEASIAAFLDIQRLQYLITEKWHMGYILSARVDCVVCDENGFPLFAAEYQGSAHDEPLIKAKDKFKKSVLENAGIPVNYYRFEKKQLTEITKN